MQDVEIAVEASADPPSVAYCFSLAFAKLCDTIEPTNGRSLAVHSLIHAYGLFDKMCVFAPPSASREDLCQFHSGDYVSALLSIPSCSDSLSGDLDDDVKKELIQQEHGLQYDCPLKPGLSDYVRLVAGGTLAACELLVKKKAKVAINWAGGWHHCKSWQASGFCYVNDCVLGIMKLRKTYAHVLYIDLDVHHGDAVQDAFSYTDKVTTVSVHHYAPGFFPCTGTLEDVGVGKGYDHCLNIPLKEGVTDAQWVRIVDKVLPALFASLEPDAVVVQCGADGLSGDPTGVFNLTPASLVHAVKLILSWNRPTLLLGGGGYHAGNTARCWVQITAACVLGPGEELASDIPGNQCFELFGPDFTLTVDPGRIPNSNTDKDIDELIDDFIDYIPER